jgi:hypothetical protein
MDTKEASAMTEASGLTDDLVDLEKSRTTTHSSRTEPELRASMMRLSERLRKATMEAPLQSLLLAFILGVLVARRR